MSRSFRFAISTCWLVAAFLLLRMAWGGSLFGITYVVRHNSPIVLVAGLSMIVGALAVTALLAIGAIRWGVRVSIALALLAVPFSIVLVGLDHGSAPVVTVASVAAVTLSVRAALDRQSGASPPRA